jgi:hypothetical protein
MLPAASRTLHLHEEVACCAFHLRRRVARKLRQLDPRLVQLVHRQVIGNADFERQLLSFLGADINRCDVDHRGEGVCVNRLRRLIPFGREEHSQELVRAHRRTKCRCRIQLKARSHRSSCRFGGFSSIDVVHEKSPKISG